MVQSQSAGLGLPDTFGAGLSCRALDGRLTLSFEWDRVEYSDILDPLEEAGVDVGADLDDGNEVHLGAEYAFLRSTPVVAVRAGVWRDPDHRIYATEDDPLSRALLRGGEDELHLAVGCGLAFKRIQIDLAADFSDPVDVASLSAIYSF